MQPWQRPPFEHGNELAVTHGTRSERRIAPRAQAILDGYLADDALPAYLDDRSFRGALVGLARAEAVVELLEDHLAELPVDKATKGALPVLEQLRRWLQSVASHRRALGLDPMSRATLSRDLTAAQANAADAIRTQADEGARLLAARRGTGCGDE